MLPISEQYILSPCEVKTMENVPVLAGYLKKITEEGVQICNRTDKLPTIHCNTTVKVNIFNSALGFKVLIGVVYLSTDELLRVVDLRSAADYEKRNFFRVKVNIPTNAYVLDNESDINAPISCFPINICDLSLSGLSFTCDREFKIDDRLCINLALYGTGLSLLCKVMRSIPVEPAAGKSFGCEFLDNTGSQFDLLCKYLFDCQREQIRLIKQNRP